MRKRFIVALFPLFFFSAVSALMADVEITAVANGFDLEISLQP